MNIFEKIRLRRLDKARDQDAARLDDQLRAEEERHVAEAEMAKLAEGRGDEWLANNDPSAALPFEEPTQTEEEFLADEAERRVPDEAVRPYIRNPGRDEPEQQYCDDFDDDYDLRMDAEREREEREGAPKKAQQPAPEPEQDDELEM